MLEDRNLSIYWYGNRKFDIVMYIPFLFTFFIFSGSSADGKPVYLHEIWPLRTEIQAVEQKYVIPSLFRDVYAKIETGSPNWAQLKAPDGKLYPWDPSSTYIKKPPFFENMTKVGRRYTTCMCSIYCHHYDIMFATILF